MVDISSVKDTRSKEMVDTSNVNDTRSKKLVDMEILKDTRSKEMVDIGSVKEDTIYMMKVYTINKYRADHKTDAIAKVDAAKADMAMMKAKERLEKQKKMRIPCVTGVIDVKRTILGEDVQN